MLDEVVRKTNRIYIITIEKVIFVTGECSSKKKKILCH